MADPKTSGAIRCVIVTPESTCLDTHCASVTLPLFDGSRGVARGHAPFIGRLGVGEVRVAGEQGSGDAVRSVFVEGGFVEVSQNAVSVVTQRAIPADKIDVAEAREALAKAQAAKASGEEAIAAKLKALEAARALVRAATK